MFNRNFFKAESIFEITTVTPLLGMPATANLRITKNPKIEKNLTGGCGLYFILHKQKLVYIGKFLGSKSNAFGGDIFSARWCRHIATLPVRGSRISVGINLVNRIDEEIPFHPLISTLKGADPITLAADRGFMVPFNRLKFAALHWASFNDPCNAWIKDFQFGYLQLSESDWTSHTTPQIRSIVSKAESIAIGKFKPICNVESSFNQDLIKDYAIDELFVELEAAFNSAITHSASEIEEDTSDVESGMESIETKKELEFMSYGYGENFLESIPEDCPQETVDAIYTTFGSNPNAQIHHTKTSGGDLRVRAINVPKPRNVFTSYWQVRKDVFFCRIHLPLANVNGPGILDAKESAPKEPLRTTFLFDCTQPGSISNLMNLIRFALAAA